MGSGGRLRGLASASGRASQRSHCHSQLDGGEKASTHVRGGAEGTAWGQVGGQRVNSDCRINWQGRKGGLGGLCGLCGLCGGAEARES